MNPDEMKATKISLGRRIHTDYYSSQFSCEFRILLPPFSVFHHIVHPNHPTIPTSQLLSFPSSHLPFFFIPHSALPIPTSITSHLQPFTHLPNIHCLQPLTSNSQRPTFPTSYPLSFPAFSFSLTFSFSHSIHGWKPSSVFAEISKTGMPGWI